MAKIAEVLNVSVDDLIKNNMEITKIVLFKEKQVRKTIYNNDWENNDLMK